MQLKAKVFRLRAKSNTSEAKSLLRHTIDCLADKEPSDLLANTFLNISESFLEEFKASADEPAPEDLATFGALIRQGSFVYAEAKVLE